MKSEELRAKQAPLKELYRKSPASALVTLQAEGKLGEGVSCSIETGRALVDAGLHAATGGSGLQVCSGDMLLQALVACAGVTLSALDDATLRAEGDLDFRGTLGVAREVPVGFQAIRLYVEIDTTAPPEKVEKLLELTQRYCVVLQTLRSAVEVTTTRVSTQ